MTVIIPTSIWLVVAENGSHEAGWPVRAFMQKDVAESWMSAEQKRVDARAPGTFPPDSWVDGDRLSIEEVPYHLVPSECDELLERMMTSDELIVVKSLPRPLCRWWLRTRPTKDAIQLPNGTYGSGNTQVTVTGPVIEFYVPWWAWPMELLHRLVFGYKVIERKGIEVPADGVMREFYLEGN